MAGRMRADVLRRARFEDGSLVRRRVVAPWEATSIFTTHRALVLRFTRQPLALPLAVVARSKPRHPDDRLVGPLERPTERAEDPRIRRRTGLLRNAQIPRALRDLGL